MFALVSDVCAPLLSSDAERECVETGDGEDDSDAVAGDATTVAAFDDEEWSCSLECWREWDGFNLRACCCAGIDADCFSGGSRAGTPYCASNAARRRDGVEGEVPWLLLSVKPLEGLVATAFGLKLKRELPPEERLVLPPGVRGEAMGVRLEREGVVEMSEDQGC
jgi:hypothetical protein